MSALNATSVHERAQEVDAELRSCVREQRALDARIAFLLAEVEQAALWRTLGYSSLTAYAREALGYSSSKTSDLLRVGRRQDLPRLQQAFRRGELSYKRATEVARVATPLDEEEWLAKAQRLRLRDLEAQAQGREREHRVQLRLDDRGFRALEAAVETVRRSGGPFDLAKALVSICEQHVRSVAPSEDSEESERAPRNASHRIVYTVCAECGEGAQETSVGPIEVGRVELEQRSCDAEVLDLRQGSAARVKRTIPTRIRNRVWARDRGRCQAPGCGLRGGIEIHHVDRWRGGHDPARMLVLCDQHHEQVHEGLLRIEGPGDARAEGCGLWFRRADGAFVGRAGARRRARAPFASGASQRLPPGGRIVPGHEPEPARALAERALRKLELGAKEAARWVDVALKAEPGRAWEAGELAAAALRKRPA